MKTIARLVTRMIDENDGLMIGILMKNNNFFKPQTVYEIVNILGELVIKEVGPSCISLKKTERSYVSWSQDISYILSVSEKCLWLTQKEYDEYYGVVNAN